MAVMSWLPVMAVIGGLIWTIYCRDKTIHDLEVIIAEMQDSIDERRALHQQYDSSRAERDQAIAVIGEIWGLLQIAIEKPFDNKTVFQSVSGINKALTPYITGEEAVFHEQHE